VLELWFGFFPLPEPLAFQTLSKAVLAYQRYESNSPFSLFMYIPLAVLFDFIKLLGIAPNRNNHYASGFQLFQQRLRDTGSCACYSYSVVRGTLRIPH
jgi:hypothetical protein